MIGNITTGNSLFGILAYNKIKASEGGSGVIFCNKMAYAHRIMKSGELPLIAHTLNDYIAGAKRAKENLIFHVSLNPHPDDKLDDFQLAEISREYMEKMGFGEQPYVVYKHSDIDRTHVHIVASFIDRDGKKVKWGNDYWRNMDICRELEQKYDLIPAVKGQQLEGGAQARIVDYPRGNVKQQVSSAVRYVLQNYRFASQGELNTLLKLFNVSAEQVEGTVRGNSYSGVVYQAMRDGEPAGKPFKSSLIGKDVGYKLLQEKYADCKDYLKTKPANVERLKRIVGDAMCRAADPHELARLLGEEKIHVVMHRAKDGRIHGVTFIDHQCKLAVNGSRLGKAFSAARFEEQYGNIRDLRVGEQGQGADAGREFVGVGELTVVQEDDAGITPESLTGSEIPDVAAQAGTMDDSPGEEPDIVPAVIQTDSSDTSTPQDAGGWSWPDENSVWDDYDYSLNPPPENQWSRPFEEYVPDMADPFTALLEGAFGPEPFEEKPPKRPKRKRKYGNIS